MPLSVDAANEILRANFAPWVLDLGLTVRSTDAQQVTLVMPANARLNREGGTVCGQALMALADTSMVLALCSAVGEFRGFPTVDVHTTFMRPASGVTIVATASVLRIGRSMAFGEARIKTDTAPPQLVANVVGSYVVPPPP